MLERMFKSCDVFSGEAFHPTRRDPVVVMIGVNCIHFLPVIFIQKIIHMI